MCLAKQIPRAISERIRGGLRRYAIQIDAWFTYQLAPLQDSVAYFVHDVIIGVPLFERKGYF